MPNNITRQNLNLLYGCFVGLGLMLLLPILTAAQQVPACNSATQQTNRVNGLCLLCSITQPAAAVDTSIATYSTLSVPVGLLGVYSEQTLKFPFTGASTDSVQLLLSFPASLLELSAISKVEVATYNGSTYNNDRQSVYTPGAVLLLLTAPNKVLVTFSPGKAYDRVEVRLTTSLLSALGSVNIHYAARKLAPPTLAGDSVSICENGTATFTATAPAGAVIHWYSTADTVNSLSTGATFTTPSLFNTTAYYVAAAPGAGCATGSRARVVVNVHEAPEAPFVTAGAFSVCSGGSTTLHASAIGGQSYKWYSQESGGSVIATGSSLTTPALTQTTNYFAAAVDSIGCTSVDRHGISVQVKPIPAAPAVSKEVNCKDEYSHLYITYPSYKTDYRWYHTATDTLPEEEEVDFFPLITSPHSFFVTATYNGCTSAMKEVSVTPLAPPAAPVLTSFLVPSCLGDTVNMVARSPEDVLFVWLYLNPAGDDLDFTVDSVLKVAPGEPTPYFAIAYAANGCFSDSVTPAIVLPDPRPTAPAAIDDTVTISAGQNAFLAVSAVDGITHRWFAADTGGNSLAEGNTFVTPPLYNDTVFYAAAFSNTACGSTARVPVFVKVLEASPQAKGGRPTPDPAVGTAMALNVQSAAYPNPFKDQLHIRYPVMQRTHVVIELLTLTGQRVALLKDENMNAGAYEVIYNSHKLPAGFYQCRITMDTETQVWRLVKQ